MKHIGHLFVLALALSMLALFWGCSASTDSQYDCVLDTDCEDNLLCRNGRCVNPNDPCLEVICDPGYRCQDGDCVPVDPCAVVTCDTPPGDAACYDMPGTCAAGVCSYDMHANDSPCTDNDLCTSGDACQEGLCLGQVMVCDQPPSNDCIDENSLRSYTGIGRCAEGACAYDYSDINCSQGCLDGGCQGDPCTGVNCDTPPEPSACYQAEGTCVSGGCQYDYNDGAGCDDGDPCRVQDTCSLGTCRGIAMDCSSPPANYCDSDSAVIYSATGTCADGDCSYTFQTVVCAEGCTDGACDGEPCTGIVCDVLPNTECYQTGSGSCVAEPTVHCEYTPVTDNTGCNDSDLCTDGDVCTDGSCDGTQKSCNTPPSNTCLDPDTLTTYQTNGSCTAGSCNYPSGTVGCDFGCSNGACVGDPCYGIICDDPPPSECVSSNLRQFWSSPGLCTNGTCNYTTDSEVCVYGCLNGACSGNPCDGINCNDPPNDYCSGEDLMQYPASGTCSGGNCTYTPSSVNCPYGCTSGACDGCTPDCAGKCGGADNGCGGSCTASCPGGQYCNNQSCAACTVPSACGDSCENCAGNTDGHDCVNLSPDYLCGCNADNDCGAGDVCDGYFCCTPDCAGKCGGASNGCGGQCTASCPSGQWCSGSTCVACDDPHHCGSNCLDCGEDGYQCLSGSCATCTINSACGPDCRNCTSSTVEGRNCEFAPVRGGADLYECVCTADIDCFSARYCHHLGMCLDCTISTHCGLHCTDCSAQQNNQACIGGTTCGCFDADDCGTGYTCTSSTCVEIGEETICHDNLDNDGDGLFDCDDPDCFDKICDWSGDGSICFTLGNCRTCESLLCGLKNRGDPKPPMCPDDMNSCICMGGNCMIP